MELEPGRYLVLRTRAFAGFLVRLATHSPYDHCAIVGPDGTIIEATPRRGVHVSPLSTYTGCMAAANVAELVTPAQREAVLTAAGRYLGEGYNWPAIGWDALAELGWHWRLLLRVCGADKRLICSQLVAQAGADAGLVSWLCGKDSAAAVRPADLARRPGVKPVEI